MSYPVLPLHVAELRSGAGAAPALPPLVLLHGFTGDVSTWSRFVPFLPETRQVLAIDLIGHGRSPKPVDASEYRMPAVVDQVASAIGGRTVGRAHWLGYSMGGRVTLNLARARPDIVHSMVLIGASPGIADEVERGKRIEADEELADFVEQRGIETFVDRWMAHPLFATQSRLGEDFLAAARAQRLDNSAAALASSLRCMGTGAMDPLWGSLPAIDVPALIVAGALDEKFCRVSRKMAELLPQAEASTVPNSGHGIHVEEPGELARRVAVFLERLDRS